MSVEDDGGEPGRSKEKARGVTLCRVLWERVEARRRAPLGPRGGGPGLITLPARFPQTLDRIERAYVAAAMECARQDRAKAARMLGTDRQAIDEKLLRWSGPLG